MTFKKVVEDFICEQCGKTVSGSGYTNHCPQCLWSKHVDIDPGDRASDCEGLMEPLRLEEKDGAPRVLHRCMLCGHEKWNQVSEEERSRFLER